MIRFFLVLWLVSHGEAGASVTAVGPFFTAAQCQLALIQIRQSAKNLAGVCVQSERTRSGITGGSLFPTGSGRSVNAYHARWCTAQINRVAGARWGEDKERRTREQMQQALAAWIEASKERNYEILEWVIEHELQLIAGAFGHVGEPIAWSLPAFNACLKLVEQRS